MRLTIDNLDGHGAMDYTMAVDVQAPITLQRALNVPTRCTAGLAGLGVLPVPARRGRVVVRSDAGTVLFSGYLATEPEAQYTGAGVKGMQYRLRLNAVSDEWLLDKQGSGASSAVDGAALGLSAGSALQQMAQAVQGVTAADTIVTSGENPRAMGAFAVEPGAGWSTNAAAAANATYAVYRALDGSITVSSAGTTTHVLGDGNSVQAAELQTAQVRELANDVTVSGEEEAATYAQEVFCGDGTTAEFTLSNAIFRGTNRTLLQDSFNEAAIDTSQWVLADAANHIQLTAAGLTVNGGNGLDGQTLLTSLNEIEMSGYVAAQLSGVLLGAGSDGMVAGFYNGAQTLANCFAGFRVRQSVSSTGSVTVLVPVVNGVETGTVYTPTVGHQYTLRVRLFCTEMQRVPQRYYCMVDGNVASFGAANAVSAPMQVVFDLIDQGVSSNTPATVLYDSAAAGDALQSTPGTCSFAVVNSTNLNCSIAALNLTRPGSGWVVSTLPNGSQQTRLLGLAGQGADCRIAYGTAAGSTGRVTFFAGRIPQAEERITVSYRTGQRSVARLADAASVMSEQPAGVGVAVSGVSRWLGKVEAPAARSSADCEAAAQAVLAMATARSAAFAGSCALVNPAEDVWPGDLLQIPSASGKDVDVLVRSVVVQDGHALPEQLGYKIQFANDWATEWADGLGLKLSDAIASDARLPAVASGSADALVNLQQMRVVSLTGSAIQIDTGITAPSGGGFEVRRQAEDFGSSTDLGDLVLRSPVPSFSIPRAAQVEAYFVRMYDGNTPPVYSRFSSGVYVSWPLS